MNQSLIQQMKACRVCEKSLPLGPRPVFCFSSKSKILLIGQAPGLKVHESGIPWDDASGNRLREWLAVSREQFYDVNQFAIVPMGLCYPGRGKSGDLPPRSECAPLWMPRVLNEIRPQLTLLVGKYAQEYFLKERFAATLTETVRNWKRFAPEYFVLPHPSPRNGIWLRKHPWFEEKVVPALQKRVKQVLKSV